MIRAFAESYGKRFPTWAREAYMDAYQKMLAEELQQDCIRVNAKEPHVMGQYLSVHWVISAPKLKQSMATDVLRQQFFDVAKEQKAAAVVKLSKTRFEYGKRNHSPYTDSLSS